MQLAESCNNRHAVHVLKSIADEERVQVGVFLQLPRELAPMKKVLCQGAKCVEAEIRKVNQSTSGKAAQQP